MALRSVRFVGKPTLTAGAAGIPTAAYCALFVTRRFTELESQTSREWVGPDFSTRALGVGPPATGGLL